MPDLQAVSEPFTEKDILDQVDRICSSKEFINKHLLCAFLKFIIQETIEGRGDQLKGYTIGVSVFDRDSSFDPEQDSLVRIHAGRLRRALKLYYLEEGKEDSLIITMPLGHYLPMIRSRQKNYPAGIEDNYSYPIEATIAILPLYNHNHEALHEYLSYGLAEDLSIELSRYNEITVINCWNRFGTNDQIREFRSQIKARFIIDGSYYFDKGTIKIMISLVDNVDSRQLWANRYLLESNGTGLTEISEKLANEVARVIGSETGIVLEQLRKDTQLKRKHEPDVFESILHFYYYESNISDELAKITFLKLLNARKTDPDSGVIASLLACMYGNFYSLDIKGVGNTYQEMLALNKEALEREPENPIVRLIALFVSFTSNDLQEFQKNLRYCQRMELSSPFRFGSVGFYLALHGEWEKGKRILDSAMHSGYGFPHYLYGATTLYYLRKDEFEKGLTHAKKYDIPGLFWGPLLRASVYGYLGENDNAAQQIDELLRLKPDFCDKAKFLVSQYVKEAETLSKVFDGLRKGGLDIESSN